MRTRDNLGASSSGQPRVEYEDLSLGRIIGAGQFGMVRIAQNKHNGDVYALKVGLSTGSELQLHTRLLCAQSAMGSGARSRSELHFGVRVPKAMITCQPDRNRNGYLHPAYSRAWLAPFLASQVGHNVAA